MPRRHHSPLNALRAFEAFGRLGRMTLAAAELSVSHGAISRHVAQLEDRLGVKLIQGPKSGLRLTDAGKRLLTSLTEGFDQIDSGVRAVSVRGDAALDVSCLSTLMMRWLIPRLFAFRQLTKGFEPRLSASDGSIDFAKGSYQVAIRVDHEALPTSAVATEIFPEFVGLVAAGPFLKQYQCRRVADAGTLPRLHTKTRSDAWRTWAKNMDISLARTRENEYEHFYFMLEAATAGLGACIAPWPLVADDIGANRLVAPFGFILSGHRYLAIRSDRPHRRAEQFCAWLGEQGRLTPRPPGL